MISVGMWSGGLLWVCMGAWDSNVLVGLELKTWPLSVG